MPRSFSSENGAEEREHDGMLRASKRLRSSRSMPEAATELMPSPQLDAFGVSCLRLRLETINLILFLPI